MYIIYHATTGEAISKHDSLRTTNPDPAHYCIIFPDWETRNAAWIANANVHQAIALFGGIEITNAIPQRC